MALTNQGDRWPRFWLIVGGEKEGRGARPLTVDIIGRGRALAVFSFEEEAQLHLFLSAPKGRWRLKETYLEELTSLLSGACCGAGRVALDPVGEIWAREVDCLQNMSWESFLGHLLARERQVVVGATSNG